MKTFFLHPLISDVPEAPGKPQITNLTEDSMHVQWTPPESDGGSPIFNYILEKRQLATLRWVRVTEDTVSGTELTVEKLTPGEDYVFRVMAENKAGPGPASPPSDTVVAKPPYGKEK